MIIPTTVIVVAAGLGMRFAGSGPKLAGSSARHGRLHRRRMAAISGRHVERARQCGRARGAGADPACGCRCPVPWASRPPRRGLAELYSKLVALPGDEGVRRLVARYPAQAVDVDDAGVLIDIDTLHDLAALRAVKGGSRSGSDSASWPPAAG